MGGSCVFRCVCGYKSAVEFLVGVGIDWGPDARPLKMVVCYTCGCVDSSIEDTCPDCNGPLEEVPREGGKIVCPQCGMRELLITEGDLLWD